MDKCGRCGSEKVSVCLLPYPNDVPIDKHHQHSYYLCEDCMYVIFKGVVVGYEAENRQKEWWCEQ